MLVAILATAYAYQAGHGGSWIGAFDFEQLRAYAGTGGFSEGLQIGAFLAFFLAFAIKVPMFPFHTWLPDAHTEAPTAGSVILAAVLLKLGAYGFVRFAVPLFPAAAQTFAPAIIVLSLIAIIYGAIVALVQPDLKRLVAYSSVSHMGFVTLGIFVFTEQGLQGAVLQMLNHGLITGALFLLVGVIYERTHDRTIAKISGLSARTPVWAAIFGFFVFASGGLPGLSGFVGEFLVLVGTFEISPWAAAVAAFVMIFAAGYLLWMYGRIVFGEVSDFVEGLGHHLTDISPVEILTLAPLAGLVVIFGVQPGLMLNLFDSTVTETLTAVRPVQPIDVPQLVVIGLVGLVVAGALARTGWALVRPSANSTTGLEPDPRPAA
jgi:NADH-quinone oxidoreductase subunit M